jgi:hypothetical protein
MTVRLDLPRRGQEFLHQVPGLPYPLALRRELCESTPLLKS